jgi:HK97 family phage major capsid protein
MNKKQGECSDEQIEDNIRKLIAEGKPQEQAIAIALEGCPQSEKSMYAGGAIKSLDDEGKIGGYLVYYGSPEMKDFDGEYFTEETEYNLDWFSKRPVLFHHGHDGTIKSMAIGTITSIKATEEGLWAEAILDLRDKYVRKINELVKQGALDWSSGTIPKFVEVEKSGFIKRWPIVEGSLTPIPALPIKTKIHSVKGLIEASKGTTSALFNDVSEDKNGEIIEQLHVGDSHEGITEMTPEELRAMVEPMVADIARAIFAEMSGKEEGMLEEEEMEVAKQAIEEEVEEEVKQAAEEEKPEDEEATKSLAQKTINQNAAKLAFVAMKAIDEHRLKHQAHIADAVKSAKDQYNAGNTDMQYGRAKTNVGSVTSGEKGFGSFLKKSWKQYDNAPLCHGIKAMSKYGAYDRELQAWHADKHEKAQSANIGPRGGFLGAPAVREELIDQLRPQLFLDQVGAQITTVDGNQSVERPRIVSSPAGEWVGEGNDVTEANFVDDIMIATPKPLAVRAALPISLMGRLSAADEATLRKNLTKSMMISIDEAALRGPGTVTGSNTGGQPLGLLERTTTNGFDAASAVDVANLAATARNPMPDDMDGIVSSVMDNNVLLTNDAHWVYRPKTLQYFKNLTDTTGQLLSKEQWTQGYEPVVTNNVQTGVGTGSNATRIYFGEWSFFEMIMSSQIEMVALDGDVYTAKLQVGILAYLYVDFLIHHGPAFAVREEVLI